jgi:hypothetical protein
LEDSGVASDHSLGSVVSEVILEDSMGGGNDSFVAPSSIGRGDSGLSERSSLSMEGGDYERDYVSDRSVASQLDAAHRGLEWEGVELARSLSGEERPKETATHGAEMELRAARRAAGGGA